MKNVRFLIALMFTIALMSTSCEKTTDDPISKPTVATLTDLAGTWNFVSLETFDPHRNYTD